MSGGQILSLALLSGIALSLSAASTDAPPRPPAQAITQAQMPPDTANSTATVTAIGTITTLTTTGTATGTTTGTTTGTVMGPIATEPPQVQAYTRTQLEAGQPHVAVHAMSHSSQLQRTSTNGAGGTGSAGGSYAAGKYGAWTPVPGHASYRMSDFSGDPNARYFGVCTWYAWYRHQGEPLLKLGSAAAWPSNTARYGLSIGSKPRLGATAVFQGGVQGASGSGHVGVVEQILGDGWFIISEMNFSWNGGGFGRIDWRYVHVGAGVSFIY